MRIGYKAEYYIVVYVCPRFHSEIENKNVNFICAYTTGTPSGTYTEQTYSYGNTSWGDKLTAVGGSDIEYDTIGNPTSIGSAELTWQGRRLIGYTGGGNTITFTYNAEGIRTSKKVGEVTHTYTLEGSTILAENYTGVSLRFLYDNTGVIGVYYNDTLYMYEKNLQGDVVALISPNLTRVVEYTYDAWGNVISTTGSLASTVGDANPIRYRSYYYDTETGLYYLQSRYYNPTWGRFINADGYISTGTGIVGFNMYAYCNNNPVSTSDSNGNWPRWITAAVAVVAAVVAIAAIATGNVAVASVAAKITIVAGATYIAQSAHYDWRETKNDEATLPQSPQDAKDLDWRGPDTIPKGPSADCHQYTAKDGQNKKYVSPDGHREVIYNSGDKIVLDARDIGTYNFCPSNDVWYSNESIGHLFHDIIPWVIFGNSDDDPGFVINELVRLFE